LKLLQTISSMVNNQTYYCWGYFIRTSLKKQVKLLHM